MRLPGLRSRLLMLALASMMPILLLSAGLAWLLVDREANLIRDGAVTRSRAVASAVDAKLDGHLAALRALGTLRVLEDGDLTAFRDAALRAKTTQPHWRNVLLIDETGRQLMNLRLPSGEPLPVEDAAELPTLAQVLATGVAQVGDLGRGPVSGFIGVPIQIRVSVVGRAQVLKLILDPQDFAALMSAQRLPETWAGAVIDGNGRFVARVPARAAGDPASPGLQSALRQQRTGWVRVPTLEGTDSHQAFAGSGVSGWTVAVAIPRSEVITAARSAAAWLAAGAAVSVVIGAALALLMSRRVSQPMWKLARAAHAVGSTDIGPLLREVDERPGFAEALAVNRALHHAAESIADREAMRRREQAALRDADQAKNEFLAMLGHELRNPLSAITTSAQVLRNSKPGADSSLRAHGVIERQARQMAHLVEDLMDISLLAMGKLRLESTLHELTGLVERAIEAWRQANPKRTVNVALRGTPAWVQVDRTRMEQVVTNLLDNAAKFSSLDGAIDVVVRPEGHDALLEVRDHGRGITPEDLPHVFETFYQGAQSLHRPQGGLGLGLALVKRLTELQGGSVSAFSAGEGMGTTMSVRLPLAAETGTHSTKGVPVEIAPPQRVVLVDDNEDGRSALELMLQFEGHHVVAVGTGVAAVDAVRQGTPDVAIIDIGLPDIDGWEVARRIREMPLAVPPRLIAISGFGQPEYVQRSLRAGFQAHLTKPVDPDRLARELSLDSNAMPVRSANWD
jgi:signal transduction histidine kinase/ActR/RegA family two-component response regulator